MMMMMVVINSLSKCSYLYYSELSCAWKCFGVHRPLLLLLCRRLGGHQQFGRRPGTAPRCICIVVWSQEVMGRHLLCVVKYIVASWCGLPLGAVEIQHLVYRFLDEPGNSVGKDPKLDWWYFHLELSKFARLDRTWSLLILISVDPRILWGIYDCGEYPVNFI